MKRIIIFALAGGVVGGCFGYLRAVRERKIKAVEEKYSAETEDPEWDALHNFDEDLDLEDNENLSKEYQGSDEISEMERPRKSYIWAKPALDSIAVDDNGYRSYSSISREDGSVKRVFEPVEKVPEKDLDVAESEEKEMGDYDENAVEPVEIEEGIVIIDNDSYDNAYPLDSHIGLYYYEGDEILTDEDGEIIDDIEDCIGDEALSEFGKEYPDIVHVRNGYTGTCYEITRLHREYHRFR